MLPPFAFYKALHRKIQRDVEDAVPYNAHDDKRDLGEKSSDLVQSKTGGAEPLPYKLHGMELSRNVQSKKSPKSDKVR